MTEQVEGSSLKKMWDKYKFGLMVLGILFGPKIYETAQNLTIDNPDNKITPLMIHLEQRYGIDIQFGATADDEKFVGHNGTEPNPYEKMRTLELIQNELAKFPPPYCFKYTGLRTRCNRKRSNG